MAITNGYCTLQELKDHLFSTGIPTEFTPQDEANLEIAIEAVSRLWDEEFSTNFYGASETKYYTPEFYDLLYVDDLISITTLKTDDNDDQTYENAWATTDYWLEPKNARTPSADKDKKPYRQIRIKSNGNYSFPVGVDYGVEIVGSWGYTNAAPSVVKQGVLLMANRIYRRKDSIFGVAGTPALGVMVVKARIKEDSDIMSLMTGIDRRGF